MCRTWEVSDLRDGYQRSRCVCVAHAFHFLTIFCAELPSVVANQMLMGVGDGTFTAREHFDADGTLTDDPNVNSTHAAVLDANSDSHLDLFVSNYNGLNQLLINGGTGRFSGTTLDGTDGATSHTLVKRRSHTDRSH